MGTACHENHNASLGFSRADKSVPDTTRGVVLYGGKIPISGQPDSRDGSRPYKEKKTLPGTLADVSEFVCVAALDDAGNSHAHTPYRHSPQQLVLLKKREQSDGEHAAQMCMSMRSTQTPPISVGRVGNINPIPFRSEGLPAYTRTKLKHTQIWHPTTLYRVTGSLRTA